MPPKLGTSVTKRVPIKMEQSLYDAIVLSLQPGEDVSKVGRELFRQFVAQRNAKKILAKPKKKI